MTRDELWEARNVVLLLANNPVFQQTSRQTIFSFYDVAVELEYWAQHAEELT